MVAASVRLQRCNLTMVSIMDSRSGSLATALPTGALPLWFVAYAPCYTMDSRSGSLATALPTGALREPLWFVAYAPPRDIESRGGISGMAGVGISPTGTVPFSGWDFPTERWRFPPLEFCFFDTLLLASYARFRASLTVLTRRQSSVDCAFSV